MAFGLESASPDNNKSFALPNSSVEVNYGDNSREYNVAGVPVLEDQK